MKILKYILLILVFFTLLHPLTLRAQNIASSGKITMMEFQARRLAAMEVLADGILLLHARSWFTGEDQIFVHGFHQNPGFYYFTGLENAVGPILAIDGLAKESWLFVPTELSGLAGQMSKPKVKPGGETEAALLIEHVVSWDEFIPFIERRAMEQPNIILYTDEPYWNPPQSNPPGLAPIDNPYLLWKNALQEKWPNLTIKSGAAAVMELRLIKSQTEIEVMRKVAKISAQALLTGLRSLAPGKTQREVEAEIVCQCIHSGGEGPSFWPWVMSGPNAPIPKPLESLADYRHLNRVMQAGELVRVDIGCDVDFYKGDVGRTAPVSGKFDPGQRESWELLVAAYKAGLAVMRDGVTKTGIAAAATAEVERRQASVNTELGKKAAQVMLGKTGSMLWHIHGSGLEAGEGRPTTLKSGMVIEFEPMFAVEGQGFYLEDMILITDDGYEILTTGLPYSADEIEKVIAGED